MAGGNPNEERGRQEGDFYPTPPEVTRVLIERYPQLKTARIWEPCAGDGAMKDVLEEHGAFVLATDIDPQRADIRKFDFFDAKVKSLVRGIVTNPPFNIAEAFIRHAWLELQAPWMALVLKSTYWHSKNRQKLYAECKPAAIHPLTWRPDFLGLGRPTMECQWCVWDRSFPNGYPIYEPLSK